jgi:hypothetical protein
LHGLSPVPERPTSWHPFLYAYWGAIAEARFFTTEVWTWRVWSRTTGRPLFEQCSHLSSLLTIVQRGGMQAEIDSTAERADVTGTDRRRPACEIGL